MQTLRAMWIVFAVSLAATFVGVRTFAQAPVPPLPLAPGQRIAWDMPGIHLDSARTLAYAVFVDGVRFAFPMTNVLCTETSPQPVVCAAIPPKEALADGVHTLEIAVTVLGVESKGASWQVVPVTVPPPANGRVLP